MAAAHGLLALGAIVDVIWMWFYTDGQKLGAAVRDRGGQFIGWKLYWYSVHHLHRSAGQYRVSKEESHPVHSGSR